MMASRASGTSCRWSPMQVVPSAVAGNSVDLSKMEYVPVGSFRISKRSNCNLIPPREPCNATRPSEVAWKIDFFAYSNSVSEQHTKMPLPKSPKSLRSILNLDACQFFIKHAETLTRHGSALWEEQCLIWKRPRARFANCAARVQAATTFPARAPGSLAPHQACLPCKNMPATKKPEEKDQCACSIGWPSAPACLQRQ